MSAILAINAKRYPSGMVVPRRPHASPKRQYPNRIAELTRINGETYASIGDRVKAHEITIAKLATGKQPLTFDWMKRLAQAFHVEPAEIIAAPPVAGMRRVIVKSALNANVWRDPDDNEPPRENTDVLIPDDPALRGADIYAVEQAGESMNLRYQSGSIIILSRIVGTSPAEIIDGRRYHVRRTRVDGRIEESIKLLVRQPDGTFWLRAESDRAEFQGWIALQSVTGMTIELVGRVRYAVQRED